MGKRINFKFSGVIALFIIISVLLCSCVRTDTKTASISVVYAVTTVMALFILTGYFFITKQKEPWFILLFTCVFIVNLGYFLMSVSNGLDMALAFNRLAYFGSVFLPHSMLMVLLKVVGIKYKKYLPALLSVFAVAVFLIAASQGFCSLYYKEVYFQKINGAGSLLKIYGPLHVTYLIYLLSYFFMMIGTVAYFFITKKTESVLCATLLSLAVFVNLGVWLIEQLVNINFEILSVSYIISELFLIGLWKIIKENQQLRRQVENNKPHIASPKQIIAVSSEMKELFLSGVSSLTPTEKQIYNAYVDGKTTKEIMVLQNITENTLKYHNKNIYTKLGVSSRKQLIEIHRAINP